MVACCMAILFCPSTVPAVERQHAERARVESIVRNVSEAQMVIRRDVVVSCWTAHKGRDNAGSALSPALAGRSLGSTERTADQGPSISWEVGEPMQSTLDNALVSSDDYL